MHTPYIPKYVYLGYSALIPDYVYPTDSYRTRAEVNGTMPHAQLQVQKSEGAAS